MDARSKIISLTEAPIRNVPNTDTFLKQGGSDGEGAGVNPFAEYEGKAHWQLDDGKPVFVMGDVDREALSSSIKDVFHLISDSRERGKFLQEVCSLFNLPTSIVNTEDGQELANAVGDKLELLDNNIALNTNKSKSVFASDAISDDQNVGSYISDDISGTGEEDDME